MDSIHNAVHDEQRLIGCGNGPCTTDTDCGGRARSTVSGHKVGTGNTSLEGVVDREHRGILDVAHLDIGHRSGKVGLLCRTIGDDHDVLKDILVLCKSEVYDSALAYGLRCRSESHIFSLEHISRLRCDDIGSVNVSYGACRSAFDRHIGTDERLTGRVVYVTFHL